MGKKSSALSLTAMLAAASTSFAGSDANGELFDWRIVLRSSTGEVPLLPFNGFPGRFQTTNHLHSTDTRFLCFVSAFMQKTQGSMPGLARYVWTVRGEPQASNGAGIGVPFAPRYVSINGSPMNALVFYIGRGPAGGNTIGLRGARNVVGTPDDAEGFRSGVRWWHADRTWGETDPRGLWTVIDGTEGISFEVQKAFDIDDTHVREFEFTARFEAAFSNDPRPLVATELTEPAQGANLFGTFRNFRWTATPNATDYLLYISEDPTFADIGPGGRSPVYVPGQWGTATESVPTYLSTQTLILDRQFYWKVVARNCFFETNEAITPVRSFRTFSAVQPPPPPPPPPTSPGPFSVLYPTAGTPDAPQIITLRWSPSADIERYVVRVAPAGRPPMQFTLPASQTSLVLPGLREATPHNVRIEAHDQYAQERAEEITFTTRACLDLDQDFVIATIDLTIFLARFGTNVPAYT